MRRKTNYFFRLLLIAAMSANLLMGCSSTTDLGTTDTNVSNEGGSASVSPGTSTEGGTNIVYGLSGTWSSLQPFEGPTTYSCMVQDILFEPLAKPGDEQLDYRNAESIEVSEDGRIWTVKLNPECTWSDGEPTTAYDWEWTYQTETDPEFGTYSTSYVTSLLAGTDDSGVHIEGEELGMKAIDDYTLEITFKNPQGIDPFFGWYGFYYRALPKHLLEDVPASELATCDFWKSPVGNGSCTYVAEPVVGQELQFAARDDYYLGTMDFDTLTYVVVAQDNAPNALLNGDIDTYFDMADYETLDGLIGQNGLHMEQAEGTMNIMQMSINNAKYNPAVRKALSMLIDREVLCAAVTYNYGIPAGDSVMNSGYIAERDVEGAIAILEAEGFDFENTVVSLACSDRRQNMATIIQQNWAEAGVKCEIKIGETATIFAQAVSGEVDCCLMSNNMSYNPTVDESILDPASTTYGQITSTAYIDICREIDFETDPVRKAELVEEYVQLLREECPMIYLYATPVCMLESARLSGVRGATGDTPWTWTVTE